MQVQNKILSFREVAALSQKAGKTRLLLRHSMRRSLTEGLDPGLTPEGAAYAFSCGELLAGLEDPVVGASPRKRCFETAQNLIRGGSLPVKEEEIFLCPEVGDDSMFLSREELERTLKDSRRVKEVLETYYSTGHAPGMKPLAEFAASLTSFLTGSSFHQKNVLLLTHDIVCVSLHLYWKTYPFRQEDWLGYIQGVFFHQSPEGVWSVSYVVPEPSLREKSTLFV
jgi:broad specificity phosphatase PhoE